MQLCFCFDFVAIVVHITLLNPLDLLFIVPVNTNTELDLLIRTVDTIVLVTIVTPLFQLQFLHFYALYKKLSWSIIVPISFLIVYNRLDYNVYHYN